MKTKAIICITAFLLIFTSQLTGTAVEAKTEVSVYYNGEKIIFDQKPIIEDGRTLVPVRGVFEKIGANVQWLPKTKTVYVKISEPFIINSTLTIGSNKVQTNFRKEPLDVAPKIINGRTYVPLRYISEVADAKVHWDAKQQKVTITKQPIAIIGDYKLYNSTLHYNSISELGALTPWRVKSLYEAKVKERLLLEEMKKGVFTIEENELEREVARRLQAMSANDTKSLRQNYHLLSEADVKQFIRNRTKVSLMEETYLKTVLKKEREEVDLLRYLLEKYEEEITWTEAIDQIINWENYPPFHIHSR